MTTDMQINIEKSLAKYLQDNLGNIAGVVFYIEGSHRLSNDVDAYECKIKGPHISQMNGGGEVVKYILDILVQTTIKDDIKYDHQRMVGKAIEVLNASIPIYAFGDGDPVFLGCASLTDQLRGGSERIKVSRMGQLDPAIKLLIANAVSTYVVDFT